MKRRLLEFLCLVVVIVAGSLMREWHVPFYLGITAAAGLAIGEVLGETKP